MRLAARDEETDADTEADADELALKHVTCKSNTLVPPQGKPNIVEGVLKVHDGKPGFANRIIFVGGPGYILGRKELGHDHHRHSPWLVDRLRL